MYYFDSFSEEDWSKRDYVMDDSWTTISTATSRTVNGNHATRYSFDVPDVAKLSHIYLRLYYRYGVSVWLNDVRLFKDHLMELVKLGCIMHRPEMEVPYFLFTMGSGSFTAYTWVK